MEDQAIVTHALQRLFALGRMRAFRWIHCAVAGCLVLLQTTAWAGANTPALPASVAGFEIVQTTDLEPKYPGAGTAVVFKDHGGFHVSLYVYTAGLSPFPTSLDDARVRRDHDDSARNVVAAAQKREPPAANEQTRVLSSEKIEIQTNGQSLPLLRDEFLVYVRGQPTRDWMYYWVAQGHIWKLRLTRVGIDPPAAFPEELLTAAAALSVANEPH